MITFCKESLQYSNEANLNSRLCSLFLTMLFEYSQGRIWAGSENKGLSFFDPRNRDMVHFPELENQIGRNTVFSFCEDTDGSIFIGTSGGLYSLNRAGKSHCI